LLASKIPNGFSKFKLSGGAASAFSASRAFSNGKIKLKVFFREASKLKQVKHTKQVKPPFNPTPKGNESR
jgi:hypothetical protein